MRDRKRARKCLNSSTIRKSKMTKSILLVVSSFCSLLLLSAQERPNPAARSGSLRQIIPGHYAYSTTNNGRVFNSGVVVTTEGALVFDALDSEAIARAQRQS